MFRITRQAENRFTLMRYHEDKQLWSIENLKATDLSRLMIGRTDAELSAHYVPKSPGVKPHVKVTRIPKYWN